MKLHLIWIGLVAGAAFGACSGKDETVASYVTPVERGRYLVMHVSDCTGCHTPLMAGGVPDESRLLAGVECFVDVDPGNDEVGCLNSTNLTNHETGLMNRSDAEIKTSFRTGVRPNGEALHPFMPYWSYANMTDEDADAIVAFLRTVAGVDHQVPPTQPPFADVPAAARAVDLAEGNSRPP